MKINISLKFFSNEKNIYKIEKNHLSYINTYYNQYVNVISTIWNLFPARANIF